MNFTKKILFSIVILYNLQISAVIFESDRLSEVFKHIEPNSLVVFDIDDTLMTPKNWPGSATWLEYETKKLKQLGLSGQDSFRLMLPLYFTIHIFDNIMIPLDNSPKIIEKLQKNSVYTMALTNRSLPMVQATMKEFLYLGIDFSINSLYKEEMELAVTHKGRFSKGIIFCGNNDKGKTLFLFLEKVGYMPEKIIFVDDKLKNVKAVERETEKHNIPFVGMRFSKIDEKRKTFNPKEADKQLLAFARAIGMMPLV